MLGIKQLGHLTTAWLSLRALADLRNSVLERNRQQSSVGCDAGIIHTLDQSSNISNDFLGTFRAFDLLEPGDGPMRWC